MRLAAAGALLAGLAMAFLLGRRLGRAGGRAIRLWTLALLVPLVARAILRQRPDLEDALFRFDAGGLVEPWWGYPFALAALGIGSRKMATGARRGLVAAFAAVLAVHVAVEAGASAVADPSGLVGVAGPDGICRQTSEYSCGAAAAATLLARLGVPADEREMAALCRTNARTGTDEISLCRGLRRKLEGSGRTVRLVRASFQDLRGLRAPAAVPVQFSLLVDHWIVVVSVDDAGVVAADPLKPHLVRIRQAAFLERWRGYLVTVGGAAGGGDKMGLRCPSPSRSPSRG